MTAKKIVKKKVPAKGTKKPTTRVKKKTAPKREPLTIGERTVSAGRRAQVELPVSRLVTGAQMAIPVVAVHGSKPGPSMWINAAIHGDEINGTEIVNQVLKSIDPKSLSGTLLAVPVVNLHGFITGERYLPDRRDLNRSFPGSRTGSLASRVAHLFMTEIVARCEVGIDLHTASDHRTNLPHIRANLENDKTIELAQAFGGPLMLHSKSSTGTLRRAAQLQGASVVLYEAGEPWRFNDDAISTGVSGVLRVMAHMGMIESEIDRTVAVPRADSSKWVRATRSGIAHIDVNTGDMVELKQPVGTIDDAFGKKLATIRARSTGLVISKTLYPLVNQGDALVHIASLEPA